MSQLVETLDEPEAYLPSLLELHKEMREFYIRFHLESLEDDSLFREVDLPDRPRPQDSDEVPYVVQSNQFPVETETVVEWLMALKIKGSDAEKYAVALEEIGVDAPEHMYALEAEDLEDVGMKKVHRRVVMSRVGQSK